MPSQNARAIIEAKIHKAYTVACDDLFMRGYLTRETRLKISGLVGEMLTTFGEALGPELEVIVVAAEDVEALAQKALAAERRAETLVAFGGGLKALGENRVGGYLIRYGNENEPDLSPVRDWFAPSTYFGARAGDGCDTTINHGIPLKSTFTSADEQRVIEYAAGLILPPIKTRRDDVGIFAECVLSAANEYEAMVQRLVAQGKMSWSSGAVEHLVKRTAMGNGTHRVDQWIIGEAAFTPTPAEFRLGPLVPLKSLVELQQSGVAEAGSTRAKPVAVSLKAQLPRPIPLLVKR